ncbi:hypothetical protein [Caulobacter sp. 17J80-11]|uniref:hypothetical protein n=1 Tax=Caulobacter sp. 17J80-11 TaxID=2763502 RepID=UPI0016535F97|nr:hypothetical protein [Caulobacter sp. 17J80-11]MBC6983270.1 hypothetical protein [Caulobacter sp. 17J80-11]
MIAFRTAVAALALLLPTAALAAPPPTAVVVTSPGSANGALVQIGERLVAAMARDGTIDTVPPALSTAAYRDCLARSGNARLACLRDVLEATPGGTPQVVMVLDPAGPEHTVAMSCVGRGGSRAHALRLSLDRALDDQPVYRAEARKIRNEAARCLTAARGDAFKADAGSTPPLVGTWRLEMAYDCADGGRTGERSWTTQVPLRALTFRTDGRFSASFAHVEPSADYAGVWRADPETGHLLLIIDGDGRVPDGADFDGRYEVDGGGVLRLDDMWLGSPGETGCGMTFARTAGR